MNFFLILLIIFVSCSESNTNRIVSKDSLSNNGLQSRIKQNLCDTSSILLRFIDNSDSNFIEGGVLVIPEKNVEIDLKTLVNNSNLIYTIRNDGTICLNKKMLLNKYSVNKRDSLFAFVYKKGVGFSNGFSISLMKDRSSIPIQIEIRN